MITTRGPNKWIKQSMARCVHSFGPFSDGEECDVGRSAELADVDDLWGPWTSPKAWSSKSKKSGDQRRDQWNDHSEQWKDYSDQWKDHSDQ